MIIHLQVGNRGCEKSEQQRQELGMTFEEYASFRKKQADAHLEVVRLELELAKAKDAYFRSCIVTGVP